ncbi:MAG TPA: HepT-like ribonuclease domain-containing protein [Nitriliruptorales bacterium]
MTPREFDATSVQGKLELLHDLLDDLDAVGEVDARTLETDRFTRHVVERVLTQLVDIAASTNAHIAASLGSRAPSDYSQSFELAAAAGALDADLAADLKASVGLRNLLTHEYGRIDLSKVAAAVPVARDQYSRYVRQVSRFLQDRDARS